MKIKLTFNVHVPLFLHGCVAHGCSTIWHRLPDNPSAHVHRYESGAVFSHVPPWRHGSWVPQKLRSIYWEKENKAKYLVYSKHETFICKFNSIFIPWSHNKPPQLVSQNNSMLCHCMNHVYSLDRPCIHRKVDRANLFDIWNEQKKNETYNKNICIRVIACIERWMRMKKGIDRYMGKI